MNFDISSWWTKATLLWFFILTFSCVPLMGGGGLYVLMNHSDAVRQQKPFATSAVPSIQSFTGSHVGGESCLSISTPNAAH